MSPKRISDKGRGRAINFNPTKEQREKFDVIQARTRRTPSDLAREALDDFLKKYEHAYVADDASKKEAQAQ